MIVRFVPTLVCIASLSSALFAQESQSPIERYRDLKFPAVAEHTGAGFADFNAGWQERVGLEFEIVNSAALESLRAGLKDKDAAVRAITARALGIRADKVSADALAELAQNDPEDMVRVRAVESLGLLKLKLDVIEAVRKGDKHAAVTWAADLAVDQAKSDFDCAAQMRRAYARGIKREEMGIAQVGKPAPDIEAETLDGRPFRLSSVIGKKPIAIYFAGFDQ